MAANPFNELSEKLDALTQQVAEMNRKMQGQSFQIDKPLTVQEAATYLCLSKSRLYHLTSQRALPFFKRGQATLFRKEELDKWLQSKRQKSADEIRQDAKSYKG